MDRNFTLKMLFLIAVFSKYLFYLHEFLFSENMYIFTCCWGGKHVIVQTVLIIMSPVCTTQNTCCIAH